MMEVPDIAEGKHVTLPGEAGYEGAWDRQSSAGRGERKKEAQADLSVHAAAEIADDEELEEALIRIEEYITKFPEKVNDPQVNERLRLIVEQLDKRKH